MEVQWGLNISDILIESPFRKGDVSHLIILSLKYQTSLFFSIKHNTGKIRLRRTELPQKL